MKLRMVLATILALTFNVSSHAAVCHIKEFNALGTARGELAQVAREPAVADSVTSDFSAGAVQSAPFNSQTTLVRLWCDVQTSYVVGTNPVATAANSPVSAGSPEFFAVLPGQNLKVSVHTNP